MVIVLPQAHTLFFGVEPLDVNWTSGTGYDRVFQFLHSFFSVGEGGKLDERRTSEAVVLADELDV